MSEKRSLNVLRTNDKVEAYVAISRATQTSPA